MACIPQLTRLVFKDPYGQRVDATDMTPSYQRPIDLTDFPQSLALQCPGSRFTDTDGAKWEVKTRFEVKGDEPVIDVEYELTCDQPRDLLVFDGPMIYVLERDEAVFPRSGMAGGWRGLLLRSRYQ